MRNAREERRLSHDWTMALVGTLVILCCTGCAASMATSHKPDQEQLDRVPTVHATSPFVPYAESDRQRYQFVGTPEDVELFPLHLGGFGRGRLAAGKCPRAD